MMKPAACRGITSHQAMELFGQFVSNVPVLVVVGGAVIAGFLYFVTLILLAAIHADRRRSNAPIRK